MDLDAVLDRVSRNCLRGQPVPDDLQRLWQAQLEGDTAPLDVADLVLVDALDRDFFEGYREQDGAPPDLVRAYLRMFEQIAFIGQTGDGGMLGYWQGEARCSIEDSPLVELDSEGQFDLWGTQLSEYLLLKADVRDDLTSARSWLKTRGVPVPVESPEDIWKKLEMCRDPNLQFNRYWDEEQAKG